MFWAGVLSEKNKIPLLDNERKKVMLNVLTPRAKIREGQLISKHALLSSGLDNSDGIYPSVKELVEDHYQAYSSARLNEACQLLSGKMLDPKRNTLIGLTLSGALTPAGMGGMIISMIKT